MEFRFDANQEYQVEAVEALASLFDGQLRMSGQESLGTTVIPNVLSLTDELLLANLQAVQQRQNLPADVALQALDGTVPTEEGEVPIAFPNFSVEMETGTGKTYVYLRTCLELCRRYGMRKFIIVVPSVAVREGVLKTLQITKQHFANLFDNQPYAFYSYDSANLGRVFRFATSDSVELMIMTIDSFNKDSNIFRQSTDRLNGHMPITLVQATRPILILDEPQNMESEKSIAALAALNPLCALRFSATHRNPYNLVYRLTPADAYQQGLVKRIEVAGMVEQGDTNQAYVRVERIEPTKSAVTARVGLHKLMADGSVKEKVVAVKPGTNLEEAAERPEYAGYVVEEINPDGQYVRFVNGAEVRLGVPVGPDREAMFRAQIRYTIEEHFRRQQRLASDGIKVLSLFFIDRVDNYAPTDGLLRRLFEEAFDELKGRFPEWREKTAASVHQGYFAARKVKGGGHELIDSTTGKTQADEDAYDLIMQDKERLLSFGEPVAFIFSHSALREGWDNPNVFQICTLNQTTSEVKKRQEVGRGMRLCVNQQGERVFDEQVNILTVVANESYERYVAQLQTEFVEAYGTTGAPPQPRNARQRDKQVAHLRKARVLSSEFAELWQRISQQTRYAVQIDTLRLIAEVVAEVNQITVHPPRIAVTKVRLTLDEAQTVQSQALTTSRTVANRTNHGGLPDLLALIDTLMERTTPAVYVSRPTVLAILRQTTNLAAARTNPQEFATQFSRIIKDKLADQLAEGIAYERLEQWYEMQRLEADIQTAKALTPAGNWSVYDQIACDSAVERDFIAGLEDRDDIKLYIKLPNWFVVPTPVGNYNPDWAIVMEERDAHATATGKVLYLVRETKDTTILSQLSPEERRKVICGSRHFNQTLGVDYQVVSSAAQLPDAGVTPSAQPVTAAAEVR